nr:fatty acid desaturase [Oculatella sp. LEGE 06141]
MATVGLNAVGVVLLTHSLVLSAYWAHEFMHGNIFSSPRLNAIGGNIVLWLNGGCYARFQDLQRSHIGHHINRCDFQRFNLSAYLKSLPAWARKGLLALEWLYFPALAFLVRIRTLTAPFWQPQRYDERRRVSLILTVRLGLFTLLGIVSPKALLLYFLAYIGMITVLRFVDAFQHTYETVPMDGPLPKRDRAYEQANTFSNVISQRYWWLNLLLLNFVYHNAHHDSMRCPWHSLHELDRDLFSGEEPHYVSLVELLLNYHQFRVSRIFSGQGHAITEKGHLQLETFYGAFDATFLVLPS